MSYLGSSPAPSGSVFAGVYSQAFNGDGSTTSFTLGRYVAQAANIEVIVNNVQQSPFDGSYTLSGGTTLVFSEAPSSGTNNIYVIYRDYPVQTLTDTGAVRKTGDTMSGTYNFGNFTNIQAEDANGYVRITSSGASAQMGLFRGGDAVGGVYIGGSADGFQVRNASFTTYLQVDSSGRVTMPYQPCFKVYATTNFSLTTSYYTVIPMAGVEWNISSAWSTSTNRFTAPVTGKYQFNFSFRMHGVTNYAYGYLRQNGSNMFYWHTEQTVGGYERKAYSTILSLNVGDYVELTAGANSNVGYFDIVELSGFLIG